MPSITRGGQRIVFDDLGAGAPVLVLAHNLLAHRGSFAATAARLARRWRVINVDLRGHGESGGTAAGFSTPELAADLAAILAELAIPRAVLVGTSLGAAAALELALSRRELVAGLVLLAATPRASGLRDRLTFGTLATLLRGVGPAPVLSTLLAGLHASEAPSAVRAATAAQIRAMERRDLAHVVRAWASRPVLAGRLRGLTIPARVVVGEADSACPRAASEALAAELGAPLVSIAGAGHTVQAERPDEVAAIVEALLAELPR